MNPAELRARFEAVFREIEAEFSHLPPRTQDRLWLIIGNHGLPPTLERDGGSELLMCRANVVAEKRRDGARFWRLYLESGSRHRGRLRRKRIYIGKDGGPEIQRAITLLREVYFAWQGEEFGVGPCKDSPELIRRLKARLDWEMTHLYDRYGNRRPDALARSLGYGDDDDEVEAPMTMEQVRTWEDLVREWSKGPDQRR